MSVKFVLDKVCNKLGYEGSLQLRWFRLEELTFWTILHSSTKPRPTTSKAHQQRENTCFMARSLSNHHLACALRSLPFHRARSMASYAVAAIATGSVCCSAPNSLPSVDAPPAGYLQNVQRFTYKYSFTINILHVLMIMMFLMYLHYREVGECQVWPSGLPPRPE